MAEGLHHQALEDIDEEWLYLLLEAKNMGITVEEIRSFLHQESPKGT